MALNRALLSIGAAIVLLACNEGVQEAGEVVDPNGNSNMLEYAFVLPAQGGHCVYLEVRGLVDETSHDTVQTLLDNVHKATP